MNHLVFKWRTCGDHKQCPQWKVQRKIENSCITKQTRTWKKNRGRIRSYGALSILCRLVTPEVCSSMLKSGKTETYKVVLLYDVHGVCLGKNACKSNQFRPFFLNSLVVVFIPELILTKCVQKQNIILFSEVCPQQPINVTSVKQQIASPNFPNFYAAYV